MTTTPAVASGSTSRAPSSTRRPTASGSVTTALPRRPRTGSSARRRRRRRSTAGVDHLDVAVVYPRIVTCCSPPRRSCQVQNQSRVDLTPYPFQKCDSAGVSLSYKTQHHARSPAPNRPAPIRLSLPLVGPHSPVAPLVPSARDRPQPFHDACPAAPPRRAHTSVSLTLTSPPSHPHRRPPRPSRARACDPAFPLEPPRHHPRRRAESTFGRNDEQTRGDSALAGSDKKAVSELRVAISRAPRGASVEFRSRFVRSCSGARPSSPLARACGHLGWIGNAGWEQGLAGSNPSRRRWFLRTRPGFSGPTTADSSDATRSCCSTSSAGGAQCRNAGSWCASSELERRSGAGRRGPRSLWGETTGGGPMGRRWLSGASASLPFCSRIRSGALGVCAVRGFSG